jgi:hypothetical protein
MGIDGASSKSFQMDASPTAVEIESAVVAALMDMELSEVMLAS